MKVIAFKNDPVPLPFYHSIILEYNIEDLQIEFSKPLTISKLITSCVF